ncbi:MAG: short chain dehydrogenase [Anaerolineaceae bacterium]|nr:short chain dehydrogenase [Anaerolineaceae bacterium]
MRLENRVALVTGGGSGIGRATALRLAQEGARVAVADIQADDGHETVRQIEAAGGAGLMIQADLAQVSETERAVQATVEQFGQLNILVNNAAVMVEKPITETTEADWDRITGVNLKGTFFCAKYAILQFQRQGSGGSIINMASVNSFYAEGGIAAYATTKGGIAQLTRALAIDHSAEGIRVNAICPGWIETPMNANFFAQGPHIREQAGRLHAIGRIGQPEEIANAVLYLASDEASFVTGTLLTVDGGFSAGLAPALGVVL